MEKCQGRLGFVFAMLLLTAGIVPPLAFGQGGGTVNTGLIFTNTNTTSNNPFVWFQDSASDSGVVPLLEVSGGQTASTLGIEVTSQFNTTTSPTPPAWSTIMPAGFGGLSLVQTSQAVSGAGRSSPVLSMCANQYGTAGAGGQGPDCWSWQVQGGGSVMTPSDYPDTLQLFRTTTTNNTSNLTVLFPAQINLATAAFTGTPAMAGQITVGPMPYGGTNANVPATFTGASTSYSGLSAAAAGPVMIQPGQLTATTPNSSSTEGALWLMQSYLGTNNVGLLACQDTGAPQGVVVCGTSSTTTAAQIIGVFDSNPAQAGATVTPIRYGRAGIKSSSTAQWSAAHYVCTDPAIIGQVVDNGTTPCNRGTYVGMSVGDTASGNNTHQVDLVQEPVVQGGALMTFFCSGTVTDNASLYMFPGAAGTGCNSVTTTTYAQPVSFSGTVKNLEVFYGGVPGAGNIDTFTVWKCPGMTTCAATSVSCQVGGTSTPAICADPNHSTTVSIGDGIQLVDATSTHSAAKDVRATVLVQ